MPTWIRADEGMLTLDSTEYRDYQRVLKQLTQALAPEGDLSEAIIDSTLQDAIFAVADIPNRRNKDATARVKEAVQSLRELKGRRLEAFECWTEVRGLMTESLPTSFGHVHFVELTDSRLQALMSKLKSNRTDLLNSMSEHIVGTCFGLVSREARDHKAAIELASREVQTTIECLNFFSDMLDFSRSWLFLAGEQETAITTTIAIDDRGYPWTSVKRVGQTFGYDIARLMSQANIRDLVKRVDRLLQNRKSELEELLLKALRWAGRATVTPLPNEAFMLYAIALECVVLPGGNQGELRHRLSQRIAKTMQSVDSDRLKLQKLMMKLYDVRSKIVHTGHYAVQEEELHSIRNITKGAIAGLLTDTRVAKLKKVDSLDRWYEERMLEG